jgi:hypothetical protein
LISKISLQRILAPGDTDLRLSWFRMELDASLPRLSEQRIGDESDALQTQPARGVLGEMNHSWGVPGEFILAFPWLFGRRNLDGG